MASDSLGRPRGDGRRGGEVLPRLWQAVLWTVIIVELSPASHAARLAVLAWSQLAVGGAVAGAAAYGLATLVVEGAAACAAAVLLTSKPATRWPPALRAWERLDAWMAGRRTATPLSFAGVAVVGGSAVAVWVHRLGPIRPTRAQHLRFGLGVAFGLATFSALQGALVGFGTSLPSSALGGLVVAVAVATAVVRVLLGRIDRPSERREFDTAR